MNIAALLDSAGDVIDGPTRDRGSEPIRGPSAGVRLRPLGHQHLGHGIRLLRAREQVALTILATELVEPPELAGFLDALGDVAQHERTEEGIDRARACTIFLAR